MNIISDPLWVRSVGAGVEVIPDRGEQPQGYQEGATFLEWDAGTLLTNGEYVDYGDDFPVILGLLDDANANQYVWRFVPGWAPEVELQDGEAEPHTVIQSTVGSLPHHVDIEKPCWPWPPDAEGSRNGDDDHN